MKRELPAYVYPKGRKGYLYFIKGGQKPIRIQSEANTPDFWAEYAKALKGTLPTPARTIKKLVDHYMGSDRWRELAANTRKSYSRHFAYFVEVMGGVDPARLRTVDVVRMRDALKDTPTDASRKVGAMVTLLNHARLIGWVKENVALGVPKLKGKREAREPWPAEMIEAYRREADGLALLIFEMCLGTGQRIGDVLAMTWADTKDGVIRVKQEKTKNRKSAKPLFIPPTPHLAAILDATPKIGLTIIAQPNGRSVSYSYAAKLVSDVRKRIGAEAWDIHCLRHSAASEIAGLPGMTDEHVQAITGHSSAQMVQLYAGPARQKARALEVQRARGQNKNRT
jgi:integrase